MDEFVRPYQKNRLKLLGKAQVDWSCAYKAKAGILQNETVWANASKMPTEAWYEMYVKPWHPELAIVGMLYQVISASSCKQKLLQN